MSKILKYSHDARTALKRGVDLVAQYTNPTLGPAGRAVVIGRIDLPPRLADDAVSIAMNVESDDPSIQDGVMLMREMAMNTSKKIKDSTATTMCLSQAITDAVFKQLEDDGSLIKSKKKNTIQLKKELDTIRDEIIKEINSSMTRKASTEDIYNVALSAGSYEWIAELVRDVFSKIGENGYVEIKEGLKTDYEITTGLTIPAGFHSEYCINNDDNQCVALAPKIYVTNQPVESVTHILPLIESLTKEGLIIIAPNFSRDVLARINTTILKTGVMIVAIKLPTHDKDDVLNDIAAATNATFSDRKLYPSYDEFEKNVKASMLGQVDKAIITSSETKFIGANGDVSLRVADIKKKIDTTESFFDKDILEKRLASLTGGTAIITVGGDTDFEKGYFKLKVENAVASVQNALRGGVVFGGGVTLKNVAENMRHHMLTEALKAPYNTIQENNGSPFIVPDNVIDAAMNTIGALNSACSIAGSLLLTEGLMSYKKDESKNKDEN